MKLLIVLLAKEYSCDIGDRNYPDRVTVETNILDMRISGHRQSLRGKATEYSNPFDTKYTMNDGGDGYIQLIVENGSERLTVCSKNRPCEICR
jgi:hypothetical protein